MKDFRLFLLFALALLVTVIGIMHFLRKRFPSPLTEQQQNTLIGPFTFISTPYAFLLGFIVVTLWQTFSTADQTASKEAEAVSTMYRLSEGLPHTTPLRDALFAYVRSVRENDWPAMEKGKISVQSVATYERIWSQVLHLAPH